MGREEKKKEKKRGRISLEGDRRTRWPRGPFQSAGCPSNSLARVAVQRSGDAARPGNRLHLVRSTEKRERERRTRWFLSQERERRNAISRQAQRKELALIQLVLEETLNPSALLFRYAAIQGTAEEITVDDDEAAAAAARNPQDAGAFYSNLPRDEALHTEADNEAPGFIPLAAICPSLCSRRISSLSYYILVILCVIYITLWWTNAPVNQVVVTAEGESDTPS